jgi:peptidoglycan/LPS O-acetylase OafA/YrhL
MISSLLLRVSVTLLLLGLLLGIGMAMQHNFLLMPAHAHLNLVGGVLMFLAGLYYRLVPQAEVGALPKVQATLHIMAAIIFPLGIAAVLSWGPSYEIAPIIGSLFVLAAIATFAWIVYRTSATHI